MMVDHEEYDTDALYEVGGEEEEEEEEEEEDWGEALSLLVRSGYTDVAFQDGHPYPEKKSLIEGASAVLEWMENTAGIEPNIFTLNSYLSVHARCLFLGRATNVYLSFEKEHGILPDTRKWWAPVVGTFCCVVWNLTLLFFVTFLNQERLPLCWKCTHVQNDSIMPWPFFG
jgi:hypothetical protein